MFQASESFVKAIYSNDISIRAYIKIEDKYIRDSDYLSSITVYDNCYDDEKDSFIGTFVARNGEFKVKQIDVDFDGKYIQIFIGVTLQDGEIEYVPLGEFVCYNPIPDKENKETVVKFADKRLLFNKELKSEDFVFPMTRRKFVDGICKLVGVQLSSTEFPNQNEIITELYLDVGSTLADAIKYVTEACGCYAKISRSNELEIHLFTCTDLVIGPSDYFKHSHKPRYGPINSVVLSNMPQNSDVLKQDGKSILENGLTEIRVVNNPFLLEDRDERIVPLFNQLSGVSYVPFESRSKGDPRIDTGDIIKFVDLDGVEYDTVVLNHTLTYTGGLVTTIESPALTKTQSKYNQMSDTNKKILSVDLKVDKASGEINARIDGVDDKVSELNMSVDDITLKVEQTNTSVYKFESGSGNLFDNCMKSLYKDYTELEEKSLAGMPLGINKDSLVGKDICIAVDVWTKNAIPRSLSGYIGAHFNILYEDGSVKKYSTVFVPGINYFQYTLATHTQSIYQRIYTHFKVENKPIKSVSSLCIEIACNGEKIQVSNPKVEFGTYPTGFYFDQKAIRDNITTLDKQHASIEVEVADLTLQSVSMTEEITTINGNVSTLQTRLQSTELKLTPTSITAMVNEKIGADGQLRNTKFMLDINGGHFYGGGLDISNNSGEKVLYADTNGNLTIKNLNAINGNFSGVVNASGGTFTGAVNASTITGSNITGGTINGTIINTDKDLTVGNNIYMNPDEVGSKYIYLSRKSWIRRWLTGTNEYMELLSNNVCNLRTALRNGNYASFSAQSIENDGYATAIMSANSSASFSNIMVNANYITTSRPITTSSDSRLKTNILDIDIYPLIDETNIKSFEYIYGGDVQVGVIAQGFLDSKYRDLILSQNKDGYYAVNYNVINMALVQKVQNMDKTIKQISGKLAELEGRALYAQSN